MIKPELAKAISARTGVSPSDTEAVLVALADLIAGDQSLAWALPSGHLQPPGEPRPTGEPTAASGLLVPFVPDPGDIEALIAAARDHPLGLAFLVDGQLGAVAVTFRTHAFTVDAARRRLKEQGLAVVTAGDLGGAAAPTPRS